jgi:hypothetical protein
MRLRTMILLTLFTFISSCKNENNEKPTDYKLIQEDGIDVELFDSTNVDENRFNSNNIIYKVGNKFKYSYEYNSTANEGYLFKITDEGWKFVKLTDQDSATVKFVIIKVLNGNPMSKHIPDYNQTSVSYKLENETTFSMSGIIENENNVWIHPPRDKFFRILELNPFPFIKAPYEIGTVWDWTLRIGSQWGDKRWKTWEGVIINQYKYEITDKRMITTEFGEIECFVIESDAISSIGETELKAFFNPKYGFVRLNYLNIDGSKTNLELIEYSE